MPKQAGSPHGHTETEGFEGGAALTGGQCSSGGADGGQALGKPIAQAGSDMIIDLLLRKPQSFATFLYMERHEIELVNINASQCKTTSYSTP